jgi:hypothetical protein
MLKSDTYEQHEQTAAPQSAAALKNRAQRATQGCSQKCRHAKAAEIAAAAAAQ